MEETPRPEFRTAPRTRSTGDLFAGPAIRLASTLAPHRAADWAAARLLTPRRPERSVEAKRILSFADRDRAPFGDGSLPVWIWSGSSVRPSTVLLVHDWSRDAGDLVDFVAPLREEGFRVIAFDAPAHGESRERQTRPSELAAAVATVARRYSEWARPHGVITHGVGALALVLAGSQEPVSDRSIFLGASLSFDPLVARFREDLGLGDGLIEGVRRRIGVASIPWSGGPSSPRGRSNWLAVHDVDDDVSPLAQTETLFARWPGVRVVRTQGLGHRGLLRHEPVVRLAVDHLMRDAVGGTGDSGPLRIVRSVA